MPGSSPSAAHAFLQHSVGESFFEPCYVCNSVLGIGAITVSRTDIAQVLRGVTTNRHDRAPYKGSCHEGGKRGADYCPPAPPSPRKTQCPNPWEPGNVTLYGKVFAGGIKDLGMGILPWIIQMGPNRNHRCLSKREAQGDFTHRGGEGHVKTEVETGVMWPQATGRLWSPAAGRVRRDPALEPSGGVCIADPWISDFWTPQPSLWGVPTFSVWSFVTAAPGH